MFALAFRALSARHQQSGGIYLVFQTFILLAPPSFKPRTSPPSSLSSILPPSLSSSSEEVWLVLPLLRKQTKASHM
ncbi:hypothetical protein CCHL11_06632 [Colletotrichum chlorophyti]|uniref:Uncharacterized protein n=1 Tax=Colletotrichum chlorophyti TaxID=708187 RepID=A0A1Q8RXQ3_9PEZI|nr:hypothetical protein CCHL11_06632 [Colletotrichum chlorophyti]